MWNLHHVLLHPLFQYESKLVQKSFSSSFRFGLFFCFCTAYLSTYLPIIPVDYQRSLCMRWLGTVPKLLSNNVSAPGIKTHCLRPLPFSTAARAWLVITGKLQCSHPPTPPSSHLPPPTHRWLPNVLQYIMAQAWDGAITRPFLSIEAIARLLLALAEQSHSAAVWCLPHAIRRREAWQWQWL